MQGRILADAQVIGCRGVWGALRLAEPSRPSARTVKTFSADGLVAAAVESNIAESDKTQKQIVRDCLLDLNDRANVEGWLPGWFAFPVLGLGQSPAYSANARRC